MRVSRTLLLATLVLSAIACDGGETAGDIAEAISAAQEEMSDIGQQIEQSEPSQDLQKAWEDLQAELTEFFTSLQSEEIVDTTRIREVLDDFGRELDEAGDQIRPELRETWESLRAQIERLLEQVG